MQHLQPNTTLQGGKYRIERVLGQGGFGNTYLGYNTEFEETVAIKEFFMKGVTERDEDTNAISVSNKDNVAQFEEQREKFKKEARRLRKLKSEHIVKVHDLFEENGTAYYVMDYIDGESLAERLKRTGAPMTETEVEGILPQILDALKEVHQQEIWHLDLKPGNIMFDKQGRAYLIDFGASKQLRTNGSLTTSTALCYTPGYAPPELQSQRYDLFGPWTDIYSLGATLYNLLSNQNPPQPIDIEDEGERAFRFPNMVSERMKKMVMGMMHPKRQSRPQCVSEIFGPADEDTVLLLSGGDLNSPTENGNVYGYVDLGLPSGTLWATCNIGATNPEDYGLYFAWGETTWYTQDTSDCRSFNWTSYKHCNGEQLTKYCDNSSYGNNGFTDTLTELEPEDDAAYVNWGSGWRMPSEEQCDELINSSYTTTIWTTLKGVKGRLITSKSNGNSLFLPAAGCRSGTSLSNVGSYGYYWSRTTDYPYFAYFGWGLRFRSDCVERTTCGRCRGQSVRPVRSPQ